MEVALELEGYLGGVGREGLASEGAREETVKPVLQPSDPSSSQVPGRGGVGGGPPRLGRRLGG